MSSPIPDNIRAEIQNIWQEKNLEHGHDKETEIQKAEALDRCRKLLK